MKQRVLITGIVTNYRTGRSAKRPPRIVPVTADTKQQAILAAVDSMKLGGDVEFYDNFSGGRVSVPRSERRTDWNFDVLKGAAE